MVFWLSLNCQNYLSYCSENGHFSPRYFFWQMFSPLKSTKTPLNPWKTWALFCWPKPDTAAWQWWKNRKHTWIGIAQLSCSCFWAMFELFCSHSAAILQLFCNSFAAILQLFCDSFEAILQIFCSYFEAICQGFDLDLPCFFCFPRVFTRFEWEQAGFPQGFHWEVCGFGKSRKTIANRMASNSMIFIFFLYHELRFQGRLGLPPTIGAGKN